MQTQTCVPCFARSWKAHVRSWSTGLGYPVPQSVPRCPSAHEPAPQHCCITDTANTSLRSHSPTRHTLPGSPTHKELSCGNMAVFSLLKDQCLDFSRCFTCKGKVFYSCLERVKGSSMLPLTTTSVSHSSVDVTRLTVLAETIPTPTPTPPHFRV